jgi:hypothetical protein
MGAKYEKKQSVILTSSEGSVKATSSYKFRSHMKKLNPAWAA